MNIFQYPIVAIPTVITLLVTVMISTNVYTVKKAYKEADLLAQRRFSNVLKETTSATNNKDKIMQKCFPYASKFASSVIGLIELYVSTYL